MGLASSQARLLFITSRQIDVSANMQRISNSTMALARDKDSIYSQYNQKLNATKLVCANGNELNYDNLMGTGAVNNSALKTITDPQNRVVLNSTYANALKGISANASGESGVKYNANNAAKFMTSVAGGSEADWAKLVGSIAETPASPEKTSNGKYSINDLLKKLTAGNHINTSGYDKGYNGDNGINIPVDFNDFCRVSNNDLREITPTNGGIQGYYAIHVNGINNNDSSVNIREGSRSIKELYSNAGTPTTSMFLASAGATDATPNTTAAFSNFDNLSNSVYAQILKGLDASGLNNKNTQKLLMSIIQNKTQQYKSNLVCSDSQLKQISDSYGYGWDDAQSRHNENSVATAMIASTNVDGIVAARSYKEGAGDGNTWSFAVDAGKFVQNVINEFMAGLTGNACIKPQASGKNEYVQNVQFEIKSIYLTDDSAPTAPSANATNESKAKFYNDLYKTICAKGWIQDDKINDSKYLNEQLNNNTYYINDKPAKNNEDYFKSVDDENAQKEADIWYDREKEKIKDKETRFDIELTQMQTEYSSLNTEYESVKSIITNNVQRSFTYFQS